MDVTHKQTDAGDFCPDELDLIEQACKPRSYASSKLRLTHSLTLTGVKCRATSVGKNQPGSSTLGWQRRPPCPQLQGNKPLETVVGEGIENTFGNI